MVVADRRTPMDEIADDSAHVYRLNADNSATPLLVYPRGQNLNTGNTPFTALGFAAQAYFAVFDRVWCVGYSKRYHIHSYDETGKLQWQVTREMPRRPVTNAQREAFRLASTGERPDGTNLYSGSLLEHRRQTAKALMVVPTHPVHGEMLAAVTGELWVSEYRPEVAIGSLLTKAPPVALKWDVYDQRGKHIAAVILPARFTPTAAGDSWVLGVAYDADDLPSIQLFRLRR